MDNGSRPQDDALYPLRVQYDPIDRSRLYKCLQECAREYWCIHHPVDERTQTYLCIDSSEFKLLANDAGTLVICYDEDTCTQ